MSDPVLGLIMLSIMVLTIFLGFPTAFTLMALGVLFGGPTLGWPVFDLLVQRSFAVMSNDVLISVPLFMFMGYVMERAGIMDRMFHSYRLLFGPLPGALAVTTMVVGTVFGIASGIVGAGVTLMGVLALPPMLRAGYSVSLASGTITSSGTLGILIPPSVMLIVYGATAGVSVVKLYAGAFGPGFLLSALFLIYIIGICILKPEMGPPLPKEERNVPWSTITKDVLISSIPISILTVFVLGIIIIGWTTPTEAAALGALGALLIAAGYGKLSWTMVAESVRLTGRTTAMVCWLFIGSSLFAAVFARLGAQRALETWFVQSGLSSDAFLWLTMFIIFLLGWPLEWTEIIVIFVPIFLPLLKQFEIDPLLFGVMVAVNLQTAFLSPPVAMAAFYLKGIAPPHVTLNQIYNGMYPFLIIQVTCLFLTWYFPELTLWLPRYLYGD
ncbi:MAG: TRAP transporter large permease subunit [Chloroflexota bacterium]|mgnify:CR=1 FL=1